MKLTRAMHRWCSAGLVAIALLATGIAHAEIAVPPLTGHVTDQTGTLTQEQKATLEQSLAAFEARKGTQLAVLMVPTTAPETVEQYALRVAEQWKLGRKKVDDGAILVVAKDDRAMRIEVGYGLEGALSDIISKRIISDAILPRFKAGDYYGGVQAGTEQIIRVVDGEPLPEPQGMQGTQSNAPKGIRDMLPVLFIAALAVGGVLRRVLGRLGGSLVTGAVVTGLAWLFVGTLLYAVLAGVASMFVTLIGPGTVLRGVGGLYGGGFGGGSGGGGFRGGGGGFGGGGASGRW